MIVFVCAGLCLQFSGLRLYLHNTHRTCLRQVCVHLNVTNVHNPDLNVVTMHLQSYFLGFLIWSVHLVSPQLPDLVSQLGSIYHMIESRVKLYQQLTRLHGKLYLLMTQVSCSNTSNQIKQVNHCFDFLLCSFPCFFYQVATNNSAKNVDNISHKAKLVYEEGKELSRLFLQ